MNRQRIPSYGFSPDQESRMRAQGRAAAESIRVEAGQGWYRWREWLHRDAERAAAAKRNLSRVFHNSRAPEAEWLRENARLIQTARREVRESVRGFRLHPFAGDRDGNVLPRARLLASCYLDAADDAFRVEGLVAFLKGCQEDNELEIGEIWALKPALSAAILERLAAAREDRWPALITSLRQVGEARWIDLLERVSAVEKLLRSDPAAVYPRMDPESRDMYRKAVARLASHSERTEREVAQTAIDLARTEAAFRKTGRAAEKRRHVGFYLLDRGLKELSFRVRYRAPRAERWRGTLRENATLFYVTGIAAVTLLIVGIVAGGLSGAGAIVAALLLALPASQVAVDFMNHLVGRLLPPQQLPKLDSSEGIPPDCTTLVAVPTMLLMENQVREEVLDLEVRYLANRDRGLYFALLTDLPDSDWKNDGRDCLVDLCRDLVNELNVRHGTSGKHPFLLLHRDRSFNEREGRWMGWERKRGKLLELNRLLLGHSDAFPVKVGDLAVLGRIQYVITLDSDTQLPRDSAARLVGTLAHPLNRPIVDPATRTVVEGYGILQPRIGIGVLSASRSRLARLYSGETGFDIYTRAVSNAYQDLCGAGIYTGKGIYEVRVLHEVLDERFPENTLLSHDLIEGEHARAGLASDIELIDGFPSHFSAYCRRKHRWARGDWQIMRWLLPRVPTWCGKFIDNPLSGISRWKILDNLRRNLSEPAALALLLAGWFFLPGRPLFWTAVSVAMLLSPAYVNLLFSLLRIPFSRTAFGAWLVRTTRELLRGHALAILALALLLHQALLALDAFGRSALRILVTRKKLLEWETASEAETMRHPKAVDQYLKCTPGVSAGLSSALAAVHPAALAVALPVLGLWFVCWLLIEWLDRAPRPPAPELEENDAALLKEEAEHAWRFFHDWGRESTNWLIPDSVQEDGTVAMRLSPTNLGLLLNARVAAVRLGMLNIADFACETAKTLEKVRLLKKHRGHLLNWYDVESLQPLAPRVVSTVDSGNLAACLWTTKQAALHFAASHPAEQELASRLYEIAEACEELVEAMDFRFFYQQDKKALRVGLDVERQQFEESSYSLLASESRIATFVAIAKGDIPQEAWFHLDRRLAKVHGKRTLLSWTGTMFEYLMPCLWMRHHPGTILRQSMEAAVHAQKQYGRLRGVPWGISESGCAAEGGEYGYRAFGVPSLALKPVDDDDALVVSPYATMLAALIDPRGAVDNLRRMKASGWFGRYGFYEAVDYTKAGARLIRSWMAHHQGMSLLAACNLLADQAMVHYFHAEPAVKATELLLNERVPAGTAVDVTETSPDLVFALEEAPTTTIPRYRAPKPAQPIEKVGYGG